MHLSVVKPVFPQENLFFCNLPGGLRIMNGSLSQQLKKGVLAEIACDVIFPFLLVVRRGSVRVRQGDAWFKTLAAVTMGHKARNS